MADCFEQCFVCGQTDAAMTTNTTVNLPVCELCNGSAAEQNVISSLQEGLAEGFVCGCI